MFDQLFFDEIRKIEKDTCIPWDSLYGKTVLVTGGTGLIGTTLLYALDYINHQRDLQLSAIALVRDLNKAKTRFAQLESKDFLYFLEGNVENLPSIQSNVDYIIHGASQTASQQFVNHAVETIQTSVLGTMNLLELAKEKQVTGIVYMSSMEVYGYPERGHLVTEDEIGTLTPLDLRNSYPISKILSESLCCAYAKEYGVHANIIRLTQTYGPGYSDTDRRIFAYFDQCVKEKKNIVLKTKGDTERAYLTAIDAATAVLSVLLKGEAGQAYNAADDTTYCSIAQMAEKIAQKNGISVEYNIQDAASNGFPRPLFMKLDTSRLRGLGWQPIN